MEILLACLGVFIIASLILPWINRSSIASMHDEQIRLRNEIEEMRDRIGLPVSHLEKQARKEIVYTLDPGDMPPRISHDQEDQDQNKTEEIAYSAPSLAGKSFEFNFGTKLPVWIGAISLIFAGFFLVKYSFESGLLGPSTRVTLGLLFGFALSISGQYIIRRPYIANYERIAQGLCGAGIVCLYFCLYSAVNLYALIPSSAGFIGMSIVTAMAVVMSLRIGQPIALFGLIGGLATPALMNASEPNAPVLFIYLFILFAGLSFVMVRRGWWQLLALSLVGVFTWTTLWLVTGFRAEEAFQMLVLQMAVFSIILVMTRQYFLQPGMESGAGNYVYAINGLAIAGISATIFAMSLKMHLSMFDWSILGLLGLAVITLAYLRPATYRHGVWGVLFVSVVTYGLWLPNADISSSLVVMVGLAAIYIVLPQRLLRASRDPISWGALQIVVAGFTYGIAYYHFNWDDRGWAFIALIASAFCIAQVHYFREYPFKDGETQNVLVGMFAFSASAFVSVGFAVLLSVEYLSIAIALQVLATLWLYAPTKIRVLDIIALILAIVFCLLQIEQVYLYGTIIINTIFDSRIAPRINRSLLVDPILHLGLPAFALLCAVYFRCKSADWRPLLLHPVFGAGLAALLAVIYYVTRDLFQPGSLSFAAEAGFIERGVISLSIAVTGIAILVLAGKRFRIWGEILLYVFIARLIWFDMAIHNPYLDLSQKVGDWILLNGITLTYLGSFVLLLGVTKFGKNYIGSLTMKAYGIAMLLLLLCFVSLSVRHAYHGEMLERHIHMAPLELYTYSVVWLLLAIGLLAIGLVRDDKSIRFAALIVMTLSILKVFLIDAANLEGLFRVFSFLGLGISLIGLSYFYTRFIYRAQKSAQ